MSPSPADEQRSARARQVRDLFEAVLDLEAVPRAAMLEARCAGEPELRAEVEELLAALDRARTADLIPAILASRADRAAARRMAVREATSPGFRSATIASRRRSATAGWDRSTARATCCSRAWRR